MDVDSMRIFSNLMCSIILLLFTHTIHAADLQKIKQVNTALTDAYITAKIETSILAAKLFEDESIPLVGINASTENGIVTITGHVIKQKSIDIIIARAQQVHGVKKIISNLTVADPSTPSIQSAG